MAPDSETVVFWGGPEWLGDFTAGVYRAAAEVAGLRAFREAKVALRRLAEEVDRFAAEAKKAGDVLAFLRLMRESAAKLESRLPVRPPVQRLAGPSPVQLWATALRAFR